MTTTQSRHTMIPTNKPQLLHRQCPNRNGNGLSTIALIVEIGAVLSMVGSVLAGAWIGVQKSISLSTDLAVTTTHPYVIVGVGVAVAGIFSGLVLLMFAVWADTYASEVIATSS